MASGGFAQESVGGTWMFCLTPLLVSVEFPQEPTYGWSRSADVVILIICADVLGKVGLLARCISSDLGSFLLNQRVVAD